MTPRARIWKPTLDCNDVDATDTFWCWLLSFEPTFANETTRFLGAGGRTSLCIQHVDEPRTGKNRVHLDLLVDDVEAVAARW